MSVFYKQLHPLLFATKIFRSEVTAFNWNDFTWNYNFFKRASPYFFLQDTAYGNTTNSIFVLLSEQRSLLSIVTNSTYHEKNLKFLKKFNAYTIGLIPLTSSPWLVSYPILVGPNEVITEYYFLTLISFIKQFTQHLQFNEFLALWKLI